MKKLLCGMLLTVLLASCGSSPDLGSFLPGEVAGAAQSELVAGEAALKSIDKLHGKSIHAKDGAMAAYGEGHPPVVQVWVSRASNAAEAREQVAVMMDRMVSGKGSPFRNPSTTRRDGVDVYRVEGLGMAHLVWSRGDLVWWVSALPDVEGEAIETFLNLGGGKGV
ncbi:MAG: hypothetical protein V3573_00660 [Desulfovibrionaceae bacterium]